MGKMITLNRLFRLWPVFVNLRPEGVCGFYDSSPCVAGSVHKTLREEDALLD